MDRTKQKAKKEKPNKYVDKDKSPSFMADVKTIKENLKIREILRTVKMNSSMRIKAPRGSKVMQNKDFNDNEDCDDTTSNDSQDSSEPPSATNTLVVNNNNNSDMNLATKDDCVNETLPSEALDEYDGIVRTDIETGIVHKSTSISEGLEEAGRDRVSPPVSPVTPTVLPPLEASLLRARDRKLSLDHSMLSKREGLSQSEVDLHSIGKSPLERKSSFFRKKMDSFLKNTTEIFKRQSLGSKSSKSVQRRGSTNSRMSVSMQSLNENEAYSGEYEGEAMDKYNEELRGSVSSLRSSVAVVRSNSSLSVGQSDKILPHQSDDSLAGSRSALEGQTLGNKSSTTVDHLNESYNQESFLHSRAISMSSGLDTAHRPRNRKTSRSNRVTWVASESLTDYFRRLIQDEKTSETQPRTDSKGRRLSYQRAVSGEDPVIPPKYQDSSLRRRKITENSEATSDAETLLAKFSQSGIPPLQGLELRAVSEIAETYRHWAESQKNLDLHYDWQSLHPVESKIQAVIKELIHTEADHIRHLLDIVKVYMATAYGLQDQCRLQDLDSTRIFLNIPDVVNASLKFWELVFCPMISDSFNRSEPFDLNLMIAGFSQFPEVFEPYEEYISAHAKAIEYLRSLTANTEFVAYLKWCKSRNPSERLQLSDLLVKPMQRLTKYCVIIERMISYVEKTGTKAALKQLLSVINAFLQRVNRATRQREEVETLEDVSKNMDPYDIYFRDEDLDRGFHELRKLRLNCPMVGCGPYISRSVVYDGELHFKDNMKEADVRVILFTDMLIVCKKITRAGGITYKMIRPKYFLDNLVMFPRAGRGSPLDATCHTYVVLDEHRDPTGAFQISELSKDPNPLATLKTWNQCFHEAKLAYELTKYHYAKGTQDLTAIEMENPMEDKKKSHPEDWLVERKAHERVAAMMQTSNRRPSVVQEYEPWRRGSHESRGAPTLWRLIAWNAAASSVNSNVSSLRSSGQSRLSSYNRSLISTNTSHDDLSGEMKEKNKRTTPERAMPFVYFNAPADSAYGKLSFEGEFLTAGTSRQPSPPTVVVHHPSPYLTPSPRSASAGGSQNSFLVTPKTIGKLGHSWPELNNDMPEHLLQPYYMPPIHITASDKLYRSQYELIQRNNPISASQQQSSPDERDVSNASLSPTSLPKQGLAASQPMKQSPVKKLKIVYSQSHSNIDQVHLSCSQPWINMRQEILPGASKPSRLTRKKFYDYSFSTTYSDSSVREQESIAVEDFRMSPTYEGKRKSSKGKSEASLSLSN